MSTLNFDIAVKQDEEYLRKLYPNAEDVPGCMTLFDTFISCNVISSQVKSLYRYGHMAECAHKAEDFKFCMSSKSLHPEERRDAWIRRRAEWWAQRRLTKSSEDIWDIRTEPLSNYPPPRSEAGVDATPTID
ncbi:unnamed protein product [Somion occarium]|uniref:NADH dehydrogenase [ubiquinone] 1 beta subcomplex subunit 7 n=1 Tax=Somion occarium TaxID=3059160 RepID=A0ABP1DL64_9APHY